MKKNCAVLAAAALSCAVLAGCGQKQEGTWNANENSIYVTKELAVESAMVYTSDKPNELYTEEGLSSYAEEAVTSYNTEHGGAAAFENEKDQEKLPAALKSCSLEGQTGKLVFEYASADDFVNFSIENGDNTHSITGLSVGTAAELAGELEGMTFLTAAGKDAELASVTGESKNKAVIVEGAGTVYVEGGVAFVTEGVRVKAGNAVITSEGTNCIVFQ